MSEITLSGPRQEPSSGGPAKELVIMLHGLGADGQDLIGLAPFFAQALPDAAFVSPDAHQPCDMAPMGKQWFSLMTREQDEILAGVRAAAPILDAYIDQEMARYGLSEERVILLGFSQGAMMALHVGLRRAKPFAGIISYSGLLVAPDTLKQEIASKPPVLLLHGTADEVVPVQALPAAVQALEENGVAAYQQQIDELGHGIDELGANMGVGFALECLGYAQPEEA